MPSHSRIAARCLKLILANHAVLYLPPGGNSGLLDATHPLLKYSKIRISLYPDNSNRFISVFLSLQTRIICYRQISLQERRLLRDCSKRQSPDTRRARTHHEVNRAAALQTLDLQAQWIIWDTVYFFPPYLLGSVSWSVGKQNFLYRLFKWVRGDFKSSRT